MSPLRAMIRYRRFTRGRPDREARSAYSSGTGQRQAHGSLRCGDRHELEARGRRGRDDGRGRRERGGCRGCGRARVGRHRAGRGGPGLGRLCHDLASWRTSRDARRRRGDAGSGTRRGPVRPGSARSHARVCRRGAHLRGTRLDRHAGSAGDSRRDLAPAWSPAVGGPRGAGIPARPQRLRPVVRLACLHVVRAPVGVRVGRAQPGSAAPPGREPRRPGRNDPGAGSRAEPASYRRRGGAGLLRGRDRSADHD